MKRTYVQMVFAKKGKKCEAFVYKHRKSLSFSSTNCQCLSYYLCYLISPTQNCLFFFCFLLISDIFVSNQQRRGKNAHKTNKKTSTIEKMGIWSFRLFLLRVKKPICKIYITVYMDFFSFLLSVVMPSITITYVRKWFGSSIFLLRHIYRLIGWNCIESDALFTQSDWNKWNNYI